MENIRLKEEYDKDYVDGLIRKNDYRELTSYLRTFQMPDEIQQNQLNRTIQSLETKASQYYNAIQKTNDKDAVDFSMSLHNGIVNEKNSYGRRFIKGLNSLGSKGDGIRITFNDNDVFNQFQQNLAAKGSDIRKRDLVLGQDNGNNYVELSKTNLKDLVDILDIVPRLIIDYDSPSIIAPYTYGRPNPIKVEGLNGDQVIPNSNVSIQGLSHLNNIIKRCDNKFNDATIGNEINIGEYQTPIIATSFKGARHQKLIDLANQGKISEKQFNDWNKRINQDYEDQLITGSFGKEIYLDKGSKNFEKITDPKDIEAYNNVLRTAVTEGNRITFEAAMSGDKFGTIITIGGKADKNGKVPDQGKAKNLNTNAQYRIFVPNLFTDSAEQSFNADTQTRAIKDYNILKLSGASKSLGDGIYLNNITDDGAIYLDTKTNYSKAIDRNEVLRQLNEYNMMDDAFRHYSYEYNKLKDNTELHFDGVNLVPRKDKDALGEEMAKACVEMAKELYPDVETKEYKQKAYTMYLNLLTEIGYDGKKYLDIIRKDNNQ